MVKRLKINGYITIYYIAEWMWCTVYRSIFGPFETKEELISNFIIMVRSRKNSIYWKWFSLDVQAE